MAAAWSYGRRIVKRDGVSLINNLSRLAIFKRRCKVLVLSRCVGERIVIGGNITLTVTKVNGRNVGIGIEAPREVRIVREELLPAQPTFEDRPPAPVRAVA